MGTIFDLTISDGLGVISIISAIMAIMVAVSVAYNFIAVDRYGKKIEEIEKRFESKTQEIELKLDLKTQEIEQGIKTRTETLERQLEQLTELNHNYAYVKNKLNDTMGQLDANEYKYLNALRYLMDNILIISSNPNVFKGEVSEKLHFECYCMATNIKKYEMDKFVINRDSVKILEIRNYWNKLYDEIVQCETSKVIKEKLEVLKVIVDDLLVGLVNNNFKYDISNKYRNELNSMSND